MQLIYERKIPTLTLTTFSCFHTRFALFSVYSVHTWENNWDVNGSLVHVNINFVQT